MRRRREASREREVKDEREGRREEERLRVIQVASCRVRWFREARAVDRVERRQARRLMGCLSGGSRMKFIVLMCEVDEYVLVCPGARIVPCSGECGVVCGMV